MPPPRALISPVVPVFRASMHGICNVPLAHAIATATAPRMKPVVCIRCHRARCSDSARRGHCDTHTRVPTTRSPCACARVSSCVMCGFVFVCHLVHLHGTQLPAWDPQENQLPVQEIGKHR